MRILHVREDVDFCFTEGIQCDYGIAFIHLLDNAHLQWQSLFSLEEGNGNSEGPSSLLQTVMR